MDEAKALGIVAALADGINPLTGEVFTADSPFQSPEVVRALFLARSALESRRRNRSPNSLPANAGKPWTAEEDTQLLTQFDRGRAVPELAREHERTAAGIQARLEKHGRLRLEPRRPP